VSGNIPWQVSARPLLKALIAPVTCLYLWFAPFGVPLALMLRPTPDGGLRFQFWLLGGGYALVCAWWVLMVKSCTLWTRTRRASVAVGLLLGLAVVLDLVVFDALDDLLDLLCLAAVPSGALALLFVVTRR